MIATGTRLGPYEVLSPVGAGGMGEVYRARDHRLERDVAVKVLPPALASDPAALARFQREARALAALSHPGIVAIYDVGTEGGHAFVVMELLPGETLRQRLRRGPLDWREMAALGAAMADALAAAHAKGIVHRDLKPENVIVTADGQVKILDFGLARTQAPAGGAAGDAPTADVVTGLGIVMGTIGYMSPEQVRGAAVDASSDVFSLGCVLQEMVTGNAPFGRATAAETLAAILKDPPPTLGVDVPPTVAFTVARCLEKDPALRTPSARELSGALRGALSAPHATTALELAPSGRRRRAVQGATAILAVAAVIGAGVLATRARRQDRTLGSLAVLPFASGGSDRDSEYLSDGLTEGLINALAEVPDLKVSARSLSFRFKGKAGVDPLVAARELGVDALVTGRLVARGDTLDVQAELVEVSDGRQIWGRQYQRRLADLLPLQDDLAREIRQKLRPQVLAPAAPAVRAPRSSEAHRAFLRGRYHTYTYTRDGLTKGVQDYNEAIRLDPGYAPAYAGLAETAVMITYYTAPEEWYPRARAAAARALEIDDTLPQAHSALAMVEYVVDHDWRGAEQEFRRALALDPDYPWALDWYGFFLALQGRTGEAERHVRRAVELEPLTPAFLTDLGEVFRFRREHDRAIEQYRRAIRLDPNFWLAHLTLGYAHVHKGEAREALAALQAAEKAGGDMPSILVVRVTAHAALGDVPRARATLEELEELGRTQRFSPVLLAIARAALGDRAAALDDLERGYAERNIFVTFIGVDPMFDSLRSEPRFADLLRRVGIPRQ